MVRKFIFASLLCRTAATSWTRWAMISTFSRSPRVAVVGAGPAGLYVCAGVLRRLPECHMDIYESSVVPYGLVRYGIAPDHPEMKNCVTQFERMFTENQDRLKLYCNVAVGKDIKFDELCADYDAVVLAYGARRHRRLQIPGTEATNVFSGGDFVFWYNGMPGSKRPLLDCEQAVVIGNGNVALDCSRIILSSGMDRLSGTDIPAPILDVLSRSKIRRVTIIGRRGPLDISFTIKELREQITLSGCSFSVEIEDSDLYTAKSSLETLPRPRKRLTELLLKNINPGIQRADRHCHLLFRRTPTKIMADGNGRVKAIEVSNSSNGQVENLPCGLLLYCIGFENVALDGVPADENGRLKMLDSIRVETDGKTLVYATGWCAHTPRGVIAHTQIDASNVADRLCADFQKYGLTNDQVTGSQQRLKSRQIRFLTWDDWKDIDEEEQRLGATHGKKREKLLSFENFL